MYGTTLRIYDPGIDAWHIIWSDPVKQYYSRQIGRARGTDIVQEGVDADGTHVRWTFTDRTPGFVPLDRRAIGRRRQGVAARGRVLRAPRQLKSSHRRKSCSTMFLSASPTSHAPNASTTAR